MKRAILVFCLLASVCCQVPESDTCESEVAPDCSATNEFIKNLQKHVSFVAEPDFSSPSCGQEWAKFGTCCKLDQLLAYTGVEKTAVSKATVSVISKMQSYAREFTDLFKNMDKVRQLGKKYRKQLRKTDEKNHYSPALLGLLKRVTNQPEASNFASKLHTQVLQESFRKNTVNCWDKMLELRSSSHCSACSGRANVFFEDGKILIPEQACSDILAHCEDSFRVIFDFYIGIDQKSAAFRLSQKEKTAYLKKMAKSKKGKKPRSGKKSKKEKPLSLEAMLMILDYDMSVNAIITKDIRKHRVIQLVEQHLQAPADSKLNSAARLCGKLVSLSSKTFIEKIDAQMSYNPLQLTLVNNGIRLKLRSFGKQLAKEARIRAKRLAKKAQKLRARLAKAARRRQRLAEKRARRRRRCHRRRSHRRCRPCNRRRCASPSRRPNKSRNSPSRHHRRKLFALPSSGSPLRLSDPFGASNFGAFSAPQAAPALPDFSSPTFFATPAPANLFVGDVKIVTTDPRAKIDSAYTSFIGATGTSGNEASTHMKHMPMNITSRFP